jgi:hypothetical protein
MAFHRFGHSAHSLDATVLVQPIKAKSQTHTGLPSVSPPEGRPSNSAPATGHPATDSSREVAYPPGVASGVRSRAIGSLPPAAWISEKTRSGLSVTRRRSSAIKRCREPLLGFRSSSEYDRIVGVSLSTDTLSRVSLPSALTESGSDLYRRYHPRLCCVFRVSHPLDALLLPKPLDRLSGRNAPGIRPPEVSPSAACAGLSADPPRLALAQSVPGLSPPGPRPPSGSFRGGSPWPPRRKRGRCGSILPWAFPPPGVLRPRDEASRLAPPVGLDPVGRSLPSPALRSLDRGGL